jgi:hypothetical protein
MADKAVPGMEFASWTSLPPGPISDALSKLKGPLLGMALQGLGVGVESSPEGAVAPPTNVQPTLPIAPVVPQVGTGPVMPQLQTQTTQPALFDQAREALRQQIRQSLGMKNNG